MPPLARAALPSKTLSPDGAETLLERATRIAIEARGRVGAPSSTDVSGNPIAATGAWAKIESEERKMQPMYEEWLASKKRNQGLRGFLAEPLKHLANTVSLLLLSGLIALLSRYVQCSSVRVDPSPPPAVSASAK